MLVSFSSYFTHSQQEEQRLSGDLETIAAVVSTDMTLHAKAAGAVESLGLPSVSVQAQQALAFPPEDSAANFIVLVDLCLLNFRSVILMCAVSANGLVFLNQSHRSVCVLTPWY